MWGVARATGEGDPDTFPWTRFLPELKRLLSLHGDLLCGAAVLSVHADDLPWIFSLEVMCTIVFDIVCGG